MIQETTEKLCMGQNREPGARQGCTVPEGVAAHPSGCIPGSQTPTLPAPPASPALCAHSEVLGLNNTRHLMT